jgi:hypothetical protein
MENKSAVLGMLKGFPVPTGASKLKDVPEFVPTIAYTVTIPETDSPRSWFGDRHLTEETLVHEAVGSTEG